MGDRKQTQHNLRSKQPGNDKPLKIIKDIAEYGVQPSDFQGGDEIVTEKLAKFRERNIHIPIAERKGKQQ